MHKVKMNYIVDWLIAFAFIGSAVSGLVFLVPYTVLPVAADGALVFLGLTLSAWSLFHTLSSLAMIVGVGLHLALHWKWMVTMTRKYLNMQPVQERRAPQVVTAEVNPEPSTKDKAISRRRFLTLGGFAAAGALASLSLNKITGIEDSADVELNDLFDESEVTESANVADNSGVSPAQVSGTEAVTAEATAVTEESALASDEVVQESVESAVEEITATEEPTVSANSRVGAPGGTSRCPKGLVDDPWPGRCRHYVDQDGTGYCDLSEVGT